MWNGGPLHKEIAVAGLAMRFARQIARGLRQLHKGASKLLHNFKLCGMSATGFTFSDSVTYLIVTLYPRV